jgi:hypothetical protein
MCQGHVQKSDNSTSSIVEMEEALPAIATNYAQANAVCKKDPSTDTIGDPCDLENFLPDSGATQHMTPRRADLFNVVEGQNLGVKAADGHVIRCSVTVKVQLHMLDDNGVPLATVLHDVMYVPGLSRRLFFITRFEKHGHFITICNGSTTLYFGPTQSPVTLINEGCHPMAADVTVTSLEKVPHIVPSHRSHDHSADKLRTALALLHQCLVHRKCCALLAPSEHGVWADTVVHMGPEQECVSCEISTICATSRNKEAHTCGIYTGEYVFLDILHPVVIGGLTTSTTFAFYLIIVDAYSRYCCIHGIPDKSSSAVIDALTRYQANHGQIGHYGYLNIAHISADSGSQFTSETFKKHCREAGIQLNLAAPKKQYVRIFTG